MTVTFESPPHVLPARPAGGKDWFFGGMERDGATLVPMNIVGVGTGNQRVISTKVDGGYDYLLTRQASPPTTGACCSRAQRRQRVVDDLEARL